MSEGFGGYGGGGAWNTGTTVDADFIPHVRITYSGVFGSVTAPVEQWSYSLKVDPTDTDLTSYGTLAQSALDALATAAKDCYNTHFRVSTPSWLSLTRVVYAVVDAEGRVAKNASGGYMQGQWMGQVAGTGPDLVNLPLQSALAVSLVTARAGATGKGRFFIPLQGRQVQVDGRILETDATAIANAAAAFIGAVNAIQNGDVSVVSSKGYASKVTSVRVGRVPDTMRSRRRSLLEGYKTSAAIS